jgi:hypothetical protein
MFPFRHAILVERVRSLQRVINDCLIVGSALFRFGPTILNGSSAAALSSGFPETKCSTTIAQVAGCSAGPMVDHSKKSTTAVNVRWSGDPFSIAHPMIGDFSSES